MTVKGAGVTPKKMCILVAAYLLVVSLSCDKRPTDPRYTVPSVLTVDVADVTTTTALCGGIVNASGRPEITDRGICLGELPAPTIADRRISLGKGDGTFKSTVSDLALGRLYYTRAYAINSAGISYGAERQFTTLSIAPFVTTDSIGVITQTTATCWYDVPSDGGAMLISRGICWNTTGNPTTQDSKRTDTLIQGGSALVLTGLSGNTAYYARAFAINEKGTSYGRSISFLTAPIPPLVSTDIYDTVKQVYAVLSGTILSDGGRPITSQGICWRTPQGQDTLWKYQPAPALNNDGSFTVRITGLRARTYYQYRSYATNEIGTGYGTTRLIQTYAWPLPYINADNGPRYRGAMGSSETNPDMILTVYDSIGPAAGQTVHFQLLTGDGHLESNSAVSDSNGKVSPVFTFSGSLGVASIRATWAYTAPVDLLIRASAIIPGGDTPQGQVIKVGESVPTVKDFNGTPVSDTPDPRDYLNYLDYKDSLGVVFVILDYSLNRKADDFEPVYGINLSGRFAERSAEGWGIGSPVSELTALYGTVTPTLTTSPTTRYKYVWYEMGLIAFTTLEDEESARTILEIQIRQRWNVTPHLMDLGVEK